MARLITKQKIINDFNQKGYDVVNITHGSSMAFSVVYFICPNGHHHKVIYSNWKYHGTRCAKCHGNAKKTLIDIRMEFVAENYLLLTDSYVNNEQLLEFICPNGHKRHITYSKWQCGNRCRRCYNLRQSVRSCGAGNNAWLGGKSFGPYCIDWTYSYKEFIKARDNYRCLNPYCNGKSERLNVHHINYIKKNCDQYNLITLCVSCNVRANWDRDWHEGWYKAIIYRRYRKRKINYDD